MLDGPHWVRLWHQKIPLEIACFATRDFDRDAISMCTEEIPALHETIGATHL
jgi:hypothetical protein